MKTVVAVYRALHQAEAALRALSAAGVPRERISLAAPQRRENANALEARIVDMEPHQGVRDERSEHTAMGATFGGVGGVLAGLLAFSLPGVGQAVGLGPMAVVFGSTAVGTLGGVLGALGGYMLPRRAARVVEEGLVAGWILVGVDVENNDARDIEHLLERFDPVDTGVGALREGGPIRERDEPVLVERGGIDSDRDRKSLGGWACRGRRARHHPVKPQRAARGCQDQRGQVPLPQRSLICCETVTPSRSPWRQLR